MAIFATVESRAMAHILPTATLHVRESPYRKNLAGCTRIMPFAWILGQTPVSSGYNRMKQKAEFIGQMIEIFRARRLGTKSNVIP